MARIPEAEVERLRKEVSLVRLVEDAGIALEQRVNVTARALLGFDGQLLSGNQINDLDTVMMAVVPNAVFVSNGTVLAEQTYSNLYSLAPQIGFLDSTRGTHGRIGTVANRPNVSIGYFGGLSDENDGGTLGQLSPTPLGATATGYQLPDGRFVVAFDDSLYTNQPTSGSPPKIVARVRPTPGFPITSLAIVPADAGFLGYAVATERLFRFDSSDAELIDTAEVQLPESAGLVFRTGASVDVVSSTGRVRSLPDRLLLSDAEVPGAVASFASACGRLYALTTTGLFWLAPASGGRGHWTAFELGDTPDFTAGAAIVSGDDLYLFTATGKTWRIEGAGCP